MDHSDQNRRAWDEVHRRRAETMRGKLGIPAAIRERLHDLAGVRVLHLQCGIGEATAELASLGALVTGVDISEEALAVARERFPELPLVRGDVHALPAELRRGRFDLVYSGGGVLTWVHDLDTWAAGIVSALAPGGELILHDPHPAASCLDPFLRWRDDYFDDSIQVGVGWEHFQAHGTARARAVAPALLAPRTGRDRGGRRRPRDPVARRAAGRGTLAPPRLTRSGRVRPGRGEAGRVAHRGRPGMTRARTSRAT